MLANIAVFPLEDLLTYKIPNNLENKIKIGSKVVVPIGKNSTRSGYVVEILKNEINIETQSNKEANDKEKINQNNDKKSSKNNFEIKEIIEIDCDNIIFFNEDLVKIFRWLSNYYNISISRVIDTALVKYVKPKERKIISLKTKDFSSIKGKKQLEILNFLNESDNQYYDDLNEKFKNISSIIKTLKEKNLIDIKEEQEEASYISNINENSPYIKEVKLNEDQEKAVRIIGKDIQNSEFHPYLLHGVTGSGKTEVYIELIKIALAQNKTAMLIVPEISLTPQLLDRFKAKLGNNIALLHSGISPILRSASWQALLNNKCKIIIGARSGIFAPIENIGVIIVDEEHDGSFKQNDSFRYNARDLAIIRGKFSNCPVVLGSATPSLESYYNVVLKKYRKISLNKRYASHQKINFELVDLNKIKKKEMITPHISPVLYKAIKETLENGEQVFVLYNKRGFASVVECESCGHVLKCPNCSISLTYHQNKNLLMCHQCDYTAKFNEECDICKNEKANHPEEKDFGKIKLKGAGTEKVFDELKSLFPQYNIEILDRDSVTTLKKYEKILQNVRDKKTNILVGTQMIAKGHDIANVSLVAIIDCDASLYFPDFRASERAYQLFTQVAGRAGRGDVMGTCIMQTRNKDHIAIQETIHSNYVAFANAELKERQEMFYPPFSFLAHIVVSHTFSEIALNDIFALREAIAKYIEKEKIKINILGPAPNPISKISNRYRWHIILKSGSRKDLNKVILLINKIKHLNHQSKLVIDIDPQDML